MEKEKLIVVLVGGLWFDKVYGNTYYNTKIIYDDLHGHRKVEYSGFAYGYGSSYYSEVKKEVEKSLDGQNKDLIFIDGGSYYLAKSNCKKGWF